VIEITDLAATRIAVRHTQEFVGCSPSIVPSCVVDVELRLT
jgi:hypothetical protein